jgi:hypothetical protein
MPTVSAKETTVRIEDLILFGVILIIWILWNIRNKMPVSRDALRTDAVEEMNYWRKREWDAKNDIGKLNPAMMPAPWEGKMTADELGISKDVPRNWRFEMELEKLKTSVVDYYKVEKDILDDRRKALFARPDKSASERNI